MTPKIERIVDAHVHLWDPARTDWYPYLTGLRELDMGDICEPSGTRRRRRESLSSNRRKAATSSSLFTGFSM